ncbi:MAG: metallophosphoesterase [Anaerolineae bacterium]
MITLDAGIAMVVTDLHGDWDAYRCYRDLFLTVEAQGRADYLIFTGDLIHSDGSPPPDRSLDIVLDVLALQATLGERLIYLLGNHELPHIYGITLQKGNRFYTPPFEAAMGEHRAVIQSLFESLPFYVRTRAGVSICHAGAAAEMSAIGAAAKVFGYSHQRVLNEVRTLLPADQRPSLRAGFSKLNGKPYDDLVRRYLAVSGPDDPRYDDLLIGSIISSIHQDFELLWTAFFTRNEQQYGEQDYAIFLDALLRELSLLRLCDLACAFRQQELLVTGHIACQGGYTVVAGRQLRLASGSHARPRRSARYLLLDTERPVHQVDELLRGLSQCESLLA